MTKQTTTITKETTEDDETQQTGQDEMEEVPPDEIELAEFLGGLPGSGIKLKIYKFVDGNAAYVFSSEPGVLTEELIMQKGGGGGKYQVTAFKGGRFIRGGSKIFYLYTPPEITQKSPGNDAGNNPEISALREMIQNQNQLILGLIQGMQNQAPREQSSVTELASALRELAALQPKQPDVMSLLNPMTTLFTKTMELAKDATGGDDSKMSWLKLIKEGMNMLPGMIQQLAPAANAGKTTINAPINAEAAQQQALAMLHKGLDYLKDKALKNADVGLYVDLVMDNIDNPMYRPFLVILNHPFEEIFQVDPELEKQPYRDWFQSLYNALKENLVDQETGQETESVDVEGEVTTGENGGSADTTRNETLNAEGDTFPNP